MKIESKHSKYYTRNFISRKLVEGFFNAIGETYKNLNVNNILDVGCGEGFVLNYLNSLKTINKCSAIDIDPNEVDDAKKHLPFCDVQVASVYELPFSDNEFDLVICSEVLEHLDNPEKALEEIQRVANKYILLSVPKEPVWRIFNMCRFKYWNSLGNTPGHVNNWGLKEFIKLASKYFQVKIVKKPLPWTVLLCTKNEM